MCVASYGWTGRKRLRFRHLDKTSSRRAPRACLLDQRFSNFYAAKLMRPEWVEGLLRLGEALKRVSAMPPVPGIEPLLRKSGNEPQIARIMARAIVSLGQQWARERTELEKPLAGELRRVTRSGRTTGASSSRARALHRLLCRGDIEPIVQAALDRAGSPLHCSEFCEIAAAAAAGEIGAMKEVAEISTAVLPYLCDPRGRHVSPGTGIHLFLLHHIDGQRVYTWSDEDEDYVDPLTRATREFLSDPDFDPKPASRLYRKWQISETGKAEPSTPG